MKSCGNCAFKCESTTTCRDWLPIMEDRHQQALQNYNKIKEENGEVIGTDKKTLHELLESDVLAHAKTHPTGFCLGKLGWKVAGRLGMRPSGGVLSIDKKLRKLRGPYPGVRQCA